MDLKDKWISEVENSIHPINRPEINPYLYGKIVNRLQAQSALYIKPKFIWISAISFILLLLLNIIIFTSGSGVKTNESDVKHISRAFHLMNENTINYN